MSYKQIATLVHNAEGRYIEAMNKAAALLVAKGVERSEAQQHLIPAFAEVYGVAKLVNTTESGKLRWAENNKNSAAKRALNRLLGKVYESKAIKSPDTNYPKKYREMDNKSIRVEVAKLSEKTLALVKEAAKRGLI